MSRLTVIAGLLVSLVGSGCAIHQTEYDQDKIRLALEQLYENQIIDNLIRAANGLPFIQVDYTNATSTVTVMESANVAGSEGLTTTRMRTLPGAALALTRMLTNMFSYGVSGANTNQIAVTANPAINNNEIYDAYLAFLNVPGSLIVSCDPPPRGQAHVIKCWRGHYYWVPLQYRYLYLRLALITTAQRGNDLLPAPDFFTVTVEKVLTKDLPLLNVKLKERVPNDVGTIEFTINDTTFHYKVELYERLVASPSQIETKRNEVEKQLAILKKVPPDQEERIEAETKKLKKLEGELKDLEAITETPNPTDVITVRFDPKAGGDAIKTVADFETALEAGGLSGRLRLTFNRPPPPNTDKMLDSLRFQLEQIRFNQLRQ